MPTVLGSRPSRGIGDELPQLGVRVERVVFAARQRDRAARREATALLPNTSASRGVVVRDEAGETGHAQVAEERLVLRLEPRGLFGGQRSCAAEVVVAPRDLDPESDDRPRPCSSRSWGSPSPAT